MTIKNIAILTSGGDAPGMNAAIRAITRYALGQNINVFGVNRGYTGLRNGDIFKMNLRTVSDILHRGGTILYSARDTEFLSENGVKQAVDTCNKNEIDDKLNKEMVSGKGGRISKNNSKIDVFVIPTNEELSIARDTLELLRNNNLI